MLLDVYPLRPNDAEPADPFFFDASVIGQFRRKSFFCMRCMRREGPSLHRDGVLLVIGSRYFAVDFECFGKLGLPFRGQAMTEAQARRQLPFVRFRTGAKQSGDEAMDSAVAGPL